MTRAAALLLLAGCSASDWGSVTLKVRAQKPAPPEEPLQFAVDFKLKGRDQLTAEATIALLAGQEAEINLGPTISQSEPQREGCRMLLRCDNAGAGLVRVSLEVRELRGGKVMSSTPFLQLLKDGETVTLER